jgi:Flp pilus assembly protein TadD
MARQMNDHPPGKNAGNDAAAQWHPAVNPADLLQQAASNFSRGRFAEALKLADDALAARPGDANLHNLAGASAMQLGNHARAEHSWSRAAALQPANAQFHLNLGILFAQGRRQAEAERSFRVALRLDPGSIQANYNLGYLLSQRGLSAEAEDFYRRTLALDPAHLRAQYNLGVLLGAGGRNEGAEQSYRRVLQLDPRHLDAALNLGSLLANQQRWIEAEHCFRRVLELEPANAAACYKLGRVLAEGGREDDAERCYRRSLELEPRTPAVLTSLGILLQKREQGDEAERYYRQALLVDPAHVDAHYNLGVVLTQLGWSSDAEQCYRQTLAFDSSHVDACYNLGALLADRGQFDEAERCYRKALALEPELPQASRNLATILLQQSRFKEGWLHYESRYHPRLPQQAIALPSLAFPQWRGEGLKGKSLLIWPEQGFGDQIQMCRYLPLLKQQGATRLTMVCAPALQPLMRTLPGVDAVIGEDAVPGSQQHDYWTLLLSIPRWCDIGDTVPDQIPYLQASPERVARWSARLPLNGFRVGLVWTGNSAHSKDALRSLPGLEILEPLWSVPGLCFISLQKGQGEEQAMQPPSGQPLLHLGADIDDFADTAAIVAQLDLVVCVDTAIAHLAGALGRSCWVLRPSTSEWRWPAGRSDSPWYPGCLRLFDAGPGGDWAAAVAAIRLALLELTKSRAA